MNRITAEHLVERVRRLLGGAPREMQAAALPWRRDGDRIEVLLVTSRDSGRWILPKGWPDVGETLAQAAGREAFEEAGIRGRVSETALGSYLSGKGRGRRPVEIFVFAMQVESLAEKWPEMKQRRRRWLALEKAARRVAEPGLARLLLDFGQVPA